jgi:hypothetical protein
VNRSYSFAREVAGYFCMDALIGMTSYLLCLVVL